jgi:hypothetical protein
MRTARISCVCEGSYSNIGDKFFVRPQSQSSSSTSLASKQVTQDPRSKVYNLDIYEDGVSVVTFKFKFGQGDDICLCSNKDFSYNCTNNKYTLRYYSRSSSSTDFFLHVTGSNFDQLYEVIFTK